MNETIQASLEPSVTDGLAYWLEWIEMRKGPGIELGLDRVKSGWQRLNPSNKPIAPTVFTVAGTNGKGSTCHSLNALARAHGYRVGLYTSPHLISFKERCLIDGVKVSDRMLVEAFNHVKQICGPLELTYFEFTTLAILWVLFTQPLDVVILEVGLGGRLDAVNCIDPDVGIITSIHLDHAAFLGTDLAGIAAEKAGIARANKPLVIAETEFNATQLQSLESRGVPVWLNGRDFFIHSNVEGQSNWAVAKRLPRQSNDETITELDLPESSVMPVNLAAALQAWLLADLKCDRDAVRRAFAQIHVEGRQQWCLASQFAALPCDCLVDAAHNIQSAQALADLIASVRSRYARVHSIVGFLKDKLDARVLAPLMPLVDDWSVVSTVGERGVSAQQMLKFLNECGIESAACEKEGHFIWDGYFSSNSRLLGPNDLIVVWGSFHVVGPFLRWIQD